jgi:hypothetical protein
MKLHKLLFKSLKKVELMNVTSISGGSVTVNGKTYENLDGGSISINNGIVMIDGKQVDDVEKTQIVNVVINGDVAGDVMTNGSIKCNSAGSVSASSGDVEIAGDVTGGVQCFFGDVEIEGSCGGGIQTSSGSVGCGNVAGNVRTSSGNIKHS